MAKSKRGKTLKHWKTQNADAGAGKLRIIGGVFRGRLIEYSGDPITRPMKHNIREALFNLVGGWVKDKAVIDLFAGTGAIGLEAISRGATQAIMIERHFPTVRVIEQNIRSLGSQLPAEVHASDTFFWVRKFVKSGTYPDSPWMVFCCPPYDFYVERQAEVMEMLASLIEPAPQGSIFVVESDDRFSTDELPQADQWDVRQYAPAQVAVLKK